MIKEILEAFDRDYSTELESLMTQLLNSGFVFPEDLVRSSVGHLQKMVMGWNPNLSEKAAKDLAIYILDTLKERGTVPAN